MATERQTTTSSAGDQNVRRTGNFIKETITELEKTVWPTPAEAWRLTLAVLAVILVLGIFMGAIDYALTVIVSKFSLIK